ncbi:MAG: antitermination protein NusG [Epulopiscium sp. Nele67-Bin002]|nr:MAG: transcription termination/antitermination protein NusG [Epulopiscium sp. Nuni2H_MBin001]OON92403.1 MAG: transcription termination/antitermination protein NusG [Epulopiscium sp. Nele67-Bin001]OON92537.1 MAG: antitermination protein NusG [Epulopiscium sp. Nele67-Bin002]
MDEAKWYVVHTYSGYENKVKVNIEKAIKNRNMQELIHLVEVPMQDEIEEKNGAQKVVQRKVFPGYVLIKMIMTDDAWYVVRNTRGVTGFVGPDSKPVPLSLHEIESMGIDIAVFKSRFQVGDAVTILAENWRGSEGTISEIHRETNTVTVMVNAFGRETELEINFEDVEKAL